MVPRDSIQAMHFSEDFHAELFAAEPEVMSPVEMAFDENGKVYVAEMMDYPEDPPAGKPARSRIRVLDNPNGDGKTWRSSIFAENVLAVSGFMPWKGGLIVTSAPDILFLKDTDGDGKADLRQVLYTGFPKVNQEARITNPRLGVDNWIYCSNTGSDGRITSPGHPEMQPVLVRGTDFRFDPISGRAEAASGPAQFGSTMDDFDHRFITQNTTHIRHVVVPMKYLARAPLLEVRAVAQDISDHGRPSAPMYPLTGPQRVAQAAHGAAPAALQRKQGQRDRATERLVHGRVRRHDLQWRRVSQGVCWKRVHGRRERQPDSPRHCEAGRRDVRGAPRHGESGVSGLHRRLVPALQLHQRARRQSLCDRHLPAGDRDAGIDSRRDSPEDRFLQRRYAGADLSNRSQPSAAAGQSETESGRGELSRTGESARQSERLAPADGAPPAAGAAGRFRDSGAAQRWPAAVDARSPCARPVAAPRLLRAAGFGRGARHERCRSADPRARAATERGLSASIAATRPKADCAGCRPRCAQSVFRPRSRSASGRTLAH